LIKTFGQYAKMRDRKLREYDTDAQGSGINPSMGDDSSNGQPMGTAGDIGSAFKDLSTTISHSLTGPSGSKILNSIVNAVLGDPQVPDRVKQALKQKIAAKWSHVVDPDGTSPDGQGSGLGNIPGDTQPRKAPNDPSMSNIVVPNPSDNLGIST
jgi:hypothetical protein